MCQQLNGNCFTCLLYLTDSRMYVDKKDDTAEIVLSQ
jgi:hypothetical protein